MYSSDGVNLGVSETVPLKIPQMPQNFNNNVNSVLYDLSATNGKKETQSIYLENNSNFRLGYEKVTDHTGTMIEFSPVSGTVYEFDVTGSIHMFPRGIATHGQRAVGNGQSDSFPGQDPSSVDQADLIWFFAKNIPPVNFKVTDAAFVGAAMRFNGIYGLPNSTDYPDAEPTATPDSTTNAYFFLVNQLQIIAFSRLEWTLTDVEV